MRKILSIFVMAIVSAFAISAVNAATGSTWTKTTTSTTSTKSNCAPGDIICEFGSDTTVVTKTGSTTTTPTNTNTPNPTNTVNPTNVANTSMANIMTETVVGTGYVDLIVRVSQPTMNVKRANIVINFPNVVTTSTGAITKGSLFDMVNPVETKVDSASGTVTFSATNANGVPLNGEVVTIRFMVKSGTVSQTYPFSVDFTKSTFTDNLNNTVTLGGDGADMVVLSSAAVTPTVVESKTGFKENMMVLVAIALLSTGFIATRRQRVL